MIINIKVLGVFEMKESIPKSVIRNRRNKIKEYTSEYNLTIEILADFFQVPLKAIESDIEAIKVTDGNANFALQNEGLKTFCIYFQKEKVRCNVLNAVKSRTAEYGPTQRDWAREGFWMKVRQFGVDCKDMFINVSNLHQRSLLQHSYSMLKIGYTMDDVTKICSITKVDIAILLNEMKNVHKVNLFEIWAMEQYKNKKQRVEIKDIVDAVCASKTKLLRGDNYYYNKKKRQNDLPPSVYVPEVSKVERNRRKEEAYELWKTTKITQEELAAKYKKSRVTIGNWIREMKAKNGELLNENHRRNTSVAGRKKADEDKLKRKENCLEIIKPLISKGASITAMSKATGRCRKNIKRYMKEEGLWGKYLEIRPELKKYQ